jgi:hypothetical protein
VIWRLTTQEHVNPDGMIKLTGIILVSISLSLCKVMYNRRRRQSSSFRQNFLGRNDKLAMLESSHATRGTHSGDLLKTFRIYVLRLFLSRCILFTYERKDTWFYLLKWFYIDTTLARMVNLIIELNYEHSIQVPGAGLPYWFLGLSLQVHIRVTIHYYQSPHNQIPPFWGKQRHYSNLSSFITVADCD